MTIKWTVRDAIRCLTDLTNPFEKTGIQNPNQKPKLPKAEDIMAMATQNKGTAEVVTK